MRQPLVLSTHDACEALTESVTSEATRTLLRTTRYRSGSEVWRQTDLPDRVFRLDSGRVHIISVTADGDEHLHRVVGPGELFGEMCFCAHRHEYHGTVARSIGRSEVSATSYDDFRRTIREDAMLIDSILQTFCMRVSEAEERQRILACRDARERLGRLLLQLARRKQSVGVDDGEVTLTMTHSDLAASAALSRPHVSVLMTEFRNRELVSYDRTSPLVIRPARLRDAFP